MSRFDQFLALPVTDAAESIESYVDRLAAANRLSLNAVAERLQLLRRQRFPAYWGLLLDAGAVETLAAHLQSDPRQMTLERYDGRVLDLRRLDHEHAGSLRAVTRRNWMFAAGSRFCPHCLIESAAWPVAWKLPWSFVCVRHDCFLIDTCPTCRLRPRSHRAKGTTQPVFASHVPLLGCCNNQPPSIGRNGRASRPCGHPLSQMPADDAGPETLRLQRRLNEWIEASEVRLLGRSVSAITAFHALQAVSVLLWHEAALGSPSTQDVPPARWRTPPPTARLTATLVQRAVKVLTRRTIDDGATQLLSLTPNLLLARQGKARLFHELVGLDELTEDLLDQVMLHVGRPSTLARRSGVQLVLVCGGLDPEQLPKLLRNEDLIPYRRLLAPGTSTALLRDTVLLDLALRCGAKNLVHAAQLVNRPPESTRRRASYLHATLVRDGTQAQWRALVDSTINELSSR